MRRVWEPGRVLREYAGRLTADRWLFGLIALAFVVRLAWLLYAQPAPVSDFNDYRTLARDLLEHRQFGYPEPTAFFLPVHPLLLALFMLVSSSDFWLGLGMVVVSTVAPYLLFRIALAVWHDRVVAYVAAGIAAVFPTFVLFAPVLATEHLFTVLMLGAMLSILRLRSRSSRWVSVSTGALLGVAALTRGEAIFYVPAFVLFVWLGAGLDGVRDRLVHIGAMVLAIVIVLLPWSLRNSLVVAPDAGLSSSAGMNFYFAHNGSGNYGPYEPNPLSGLPAADASRRGWSLAFDYLGENPLRLFKDVRIGVTRFFGFDDYPLFWSTRDIDHRGDRDFTTKPLRLSVVLGQSNRVAATGLLVIAAASVLMWGTWTTEVRTLLLPLILSPLVLRTVIYWAMPRFRYFFDVLAVLLAAAAIVALRRAGTRPLSPGDVGHPVP